jgi:plasmid stabilization system protein ParE
MDKIEKIIWTQDGIDSLEDIILYIAKDSVYYASNFAKNILTRIENLMKFPYSGRIVPEYSNPAIREIIYQNYRIVYKIEKKTIFLALVTHGSQTLPSNI